MHPARAILFQQLRAALPALKREFPLRRLALFGSVVRDEASSKSLRIASWCRATQKTFHPVSLGFDFPIGGKVPLQANEKVIRS
jgi:hypothetical protein